MKCAPSSHHAVYALYKLSMTLPPSTGSLLLRRRSLSILGLSSAWLLCVGSVEIGRDVRT